jgi:flagellar motor switch/type III secretory pathway protein FliN
MAAGSGTARAAEKAPGKSAGEAVAAPVMSERAESAEDARWIPVLQLPCELVVDLPLPGFQISDFLKLRPGSVINAHWRMGQDVPLHLNGMLMGWGEFEVMGNNLAVRLTELV